jgi:acid phosphatase type 7
MSTDPKTLFSFGEPRPLKVLAMREAAKNAFAAAGTSDSLAAAMEAAATEFARAHFKPLPVPTGQAPYRKSLESILGNERVAAIAQAGKFVFHTVGDTGAHGHGTEAQDAVSFHMEQQLEDDVPEADKPAIFYHLGDVVYFNGELNLYPEQFYEPYKFYQVPIVAIPGNHDGDNVPSEVSLDSFVKNFCTSAPGTPPMAGQSARLTMTQPNVYFTLEAPFLTIIGLYSNTTGDLDAPRAAVTPQFDWLVGELRAAPADKFLIVAVHHPPFSADNVHGGEMRIGEALDRAFEATGRLPHLVLTAHVHDYQKFSRTQQVGGGEPRTILYVVAGAGGYCGFSTLHRVKSDVPFPEGVTLLESNDKLPGFLRVTVTAQKLTGEYFVVPPPPNHDVPDHPATLFDTFTVDR